MSSSVSALFQSLRVGTTHLHHRVIIAPLTRTTSTVHSELAKTYYAQRSSVPGTLMISEATFIAPQAAGYANVPGIWNDTQIDGWKKGCVSQHPTTTVCTEFTAYKTTGAIHANGSYIFLQLWALGRAADPAILRQEGGFDLVSPSPIPEYGGSVDNRVRLPLEVIDTVVETIGAERTAVRISPWSKYMGMKNPLPAFTNFIG